MIAQRGGKLFGLGLRPAGALVLSLGLFAQGCTEDGPKATLTIVSPRDGLTLNRADDLDPAKDGVQGEVLVSAANAEGATVRLSAVSGSLVESGIAVVQGGSARIGFTLGADVTLVAEASLASGGNATSAPVALHFDAAEKACRFTSPADGDTLLAQNDASTSDGFQSDVRVRCAGVPLGIPVTLVANGSKWAQAPLGAGGQVVFQGVDLAEGENLLHAEAQLSQSEKISTDATVQVAAGGCRLVVTPASGTVFNARGEGGAVADTTLGAPMNAVVVVETGEGCAGATIALERGSETIATQPATPPSTRFTVQLADGDAVLRARATGPSKGLSPIVRYTVDAVVPSTQLLSPRGGETFDDKADKSTDPGLQIPVKGRFTGIEPGTAFEVVIDPGAGETVLTQTLGADGSFDLLVTLPNGSHSLFVRSKRDSGTTTRSETVSFKTSFLGASFAIQQPANGAHLGLVRDAQPTTPGFQIAFAFAATNLSGAQGEVTCGGSPVPFTVGQNGTAQALVTVLAEQCGGSRVVCQAHVTSSSNSLFQAAPVTLHVDQVPPVVTVLHPQAGEILATNLVSVQATTVCVGETQTAQLLRGTEVLAGPLPVESNAVSFDQVVLPSGESLLTVRVADEAGNETDQSVTVFVDSDLPQVAFVDPAPNANPVLGAADDQQGDLSDGFQHDVVVEVPNELVGTLVELQVGGRAPFSARTADVNGQRHATFPKVSLPEGRTTLRACATDEAGSVACVELDVTVATGRPTCAIESPQDGAALGRRDDADAGQAGVQTGVVVATDLAAGSTVRLQLDGPTGTTYALATSDGSRARFPRVTFEAEGSYTLGASCQPAAGPGTSALPNRVEVDFTAPAFEVVDPVEDQIYNLASADRGAAPGFQIDVKVKALETASGLVARLTTSCGQGPQEQAPVALNTLGEGTFRSVTVPEVAACDLTVTVEDSAGNVSPPLVRHVRVDRVAPVVAITSPANGAILGKARDADPATLQFELASVVVTADGTVLAPQLKVGSTAISGGSSSPTGPQSTRATWSLVPLAEGRNDLVATAVDDAGNSTSVTATVTVDTLSPVVTITSFVDGQVLSRKNDLDGAMAGLQQNVRLTGEKLVNGTTVRVCSPQGTGSQLCSGGGKVLAQAVLGGGEAVLQKVTLPEGKGVQLSAEAVDIAGNTATSATVTITVDTQGPQVGAFTLRQVQGSSETALDVSSGTVTLSAAQDSNPSLPGFQVRLRATLTGVEPGRGLRAAFVDSNPAPGTLLGSALIADDGTVTLDATLLDGGHRLHVLANDLAGNGTSTPEQPVAGETPVTLNFAVDLTPPTIAIVHPLPGAKLLAEHDLGPAPGLQYRFEIDSDAGPGRTVQLLLDGQPLADGTGELPLGGGRLFILATLPEGSHQVSATVSDAAGNGATSTAVPLTVDSLAPQVAIATPANGDTPVDASPDQQGFQVAVQVTYGQVESGQPLVLTSSLGGVVDQTTTGSAGQANFLVTLPGGTQTLTASATDVSGNKTTSAAVSINVNTNAPSIRFQSPENPLLFGIAQDKVPGGDCNVDILATSDRDGAQAELLVDGLPQATGTVAGGAVAFSDVRIPAGQTVSLRLRATFNALVGVSSARQATCDLVKPTVAFTDPSTPTVSYVAFGNTVSGARADKFAGSPLEADFTVRVADALGGRVVLESDKDHLVASQAITQSGTVTVTFANFVLRAAGTHTLTAKAYDAAGNEQAATLTAQVDVVPPAAVNLAASITDGRKSAISLAFQAPGDDGTAGQKVAGYQVRRAAAPIVDQNGWAAATPVTALPATLVDPGSVQTLVVEGLPFEAKYHFAVRALDQAGNLGPLGVGAQVDLSLVRQALAVPAGNFAQVRLAVGDLNGDGVDDLVASSPVFASGSEVNNGKVSIFYGGTTVGSPVELVGAANTRFGTAVAVGDVNGDGAQDLLVGAVWQPLTTGATSREGAVQIFLGAPNRKLSASSLPDATVFGNVNATTASGIGIQVAVVPDVDGDGVNDLLVGSSSENNNRGRAYLLAGKRSWPAVGSVATALSVISCRFSTTGGPGLATRVAVLGDLDGDGAGDFALSASGGTFASGDNRLRPVFVVSGKLARGAVDAEDVGVSVMAGYTDATITGSQFGFDLAAGDWNGDGKRDLAVADPWKSHVLLFSGALIAQEMPTAPISGPQLSSATAFASLRLSDTRLFGDMVRNVGDVNGDGIDDVAASRVSGTPLNEVRVWFGRTQGAWGNSEVTIAGQNVFGVGVAAGRLTGSTTRDIVVADGGGTAQLLSGPAVSAP